MHIFEFVKYPYQWDKKNSTYIRVKVSTIIAYNVYYKTADIPSFYLLFLFVEVPCLKALSELWSNQKVSLILYLSVMSLS